MFALHSFYLEGFLIKHVLQLLLFGFVGTAATATALSLKMFDGGIYPKACYYNNNSDNDIILPKNAPSFCAFQRFNHINLLVLSCNHKSNKQGHTKGKRNADNKSG